MNLCPIYDWVVIVQEKDADKFGTIIIPESARKKLSRGVVKAIGDGKMLMDGKLVAPKVKPGDSVLFSDNVGTQLSVDGEDLLLLQENAILAIVHKE